MFPPHRVPQPAVFNDPPMPPFSHRINGSDYPPTRFPAPRFGHGHPAPFVEENFGGPSRGSFGSRRSASPVFDGDTHRYPDTARPFDHMDRQDALVEVDYSRPRPPQQMHFLGQPQFPTPMDFSGPSRFGTRVAQPLPRPRPFRPILEKPRRFGPPQYDTARARRIALTYFCDVCKVGCGGPKALYDHKNGQRHKKRLSQVEEMERLKSKEKAQAENTTTNPRTNEFRCELCNVGCTGTDAFSAHLTGRVHRRTLRLHRALGKPIPSLPDPLDVIKMSDDSDREPPKVETPSTNTGVTHTPTTRPDTTSTQQTAATRTEEKLVGEEYVVAFPAPGGMGVHFRCGLCECQFNNKEAKELHMRGRRHRLQYKKKVDPLLVVEPKQRKAPVKRKVLLGPRPDMVSMLRVPHVHRPITNSGVSAQNRLRRMDVLTRIMFQLTLLRLLTLLSLWNRHRIKPARSLRTCLLQRAVRRLPLKRIGLRPLRPIPVAFQSSSLRARHFLKELLSHATHQRPCRTIPELTL